MSGCPVFWLVSIRRDRSLARKTTSYSRARNTAERITREDLVYEAKLASSSTDEETTFHFVLATDRYKDNRIPPKGFDITKAATPLVEPYWMGFPASDHYSADEYLGGYDEIRLNRPAESTGWKATLFYQTTSRESSSCATRSEAPPPPWPARPPPANRKPTSFRRTLSSPRWLTGERLSGSSGLPIFRAGDRPERRV